MDVPITIYDWQCKYATRKWIYTAATRARQLSHIHFDGGRDIFEERADLVTSYFKKKVDGYTQQDKKAGRIIDPETYVTVEWLEAVCGKSCQNCGDSNVTAQRINNDLGHQIDNIVPFCAHCNVSLGARE